jgi:hypothetical protein
MLVLIGLLRLLELFTSIAQPKVGEERTEEDKEVEHSSHDAYRSLELLR